MPYSRTVRTIFSDGRGPPRVVTKTFTDGDEDQGGISGGLDFGGRGRISGNIGGNDHGMNIRFGGGSAGGYTQRPQVSGRSTRKEKKNPFAGLAKQSYEDIVKKCKEEGILFEDPEFPAEDSSIFFSRRPPKPFEWKRPTEIGDNALFVSEGASRFDVQQGELGDCWLLAAVASLTCNPGLLHRVVPQEQRFDGSNYCGVFCFNFWHQGDWMEVVVDDRLPTYYNKLTFMHSTDSNEFWSALLEKAYAKICGSYEALKGGSTCEAMEDFTGGVTEAIDLQKAPAKLFTIMLKAADRGSLMGCSIDADPNQLEAELSNGLIMGHAYSVTAVKLVAIQTPRMNGNIPLIRVRNPWGNEAEWKGAWSDQSKEWQYIPEAEKREIGLTFDDDGEFWMSFEDFTSNFQKLEICNLGPDSLDADEIHTSGKKRWEATAETGEWIPRVNAGGCRNFLETFATNPQYRVTLTDPDEDDDENECTMLVGLLQKDRRKKRKEGLDMLTIGYVIYKQKDETQESGPLEQRFFKYNASVAKAPSFINMREVCGRHKLPPGTYVIIPSTFEPNQQGEFLLRIFSEKASTASEMDESTRIIDDQRSGSHPRPVQDTTPAPDPYAGRDPPPIGFDLMTKDDYRRPNPPLPSNYGFFSDYGYGSAPPSTGYGQPYGGSPAPMSGADTNQGQGYPAYPNPAYSGAGTTLGFNPSYGAPPDQGGNPGALGFQGAGQYYPGQQPPQQNYGQQPGYPAGPGQFNPAPPQNQYYQSSQYNQPGFGGGNVGQGYYQGAPPQSAAPGYGWPQGGVPQGSQGGYAPPPPSQSAPYGAPYQQDMVQSQSSSQCMAAPPYNYAHLNKFAPPSQYQVRSVGGMNYVMPLKVASLAAAPPTSSPSQSGKLPHILPKLQGVHSSSVDPIGEKRVVRRKTRKVMATAPNATAALFGGGTGLEQTSRTRQEPAPVRFQTKAEALQFFKDEWKKPSAPPTEEEQEQGQKLREGFKKMAGEDMEIDAYELKDVVNAVFQKEFQFDGFSVDVCRSMVAMHDGDLSGKLGFEEFKTLWNDLRRWKAVFKKFDKDSSGHLSSYELRNALRDSGFRLSNRSLSALIMRYCNKEGEIEFDDFVMCAIRLKTMLESFKTLDTESTGIAAFDVDHFIQTTMYS